MERVKIQHPNLPDHDPIEVAKSALPFHTNAGWVEVPADTGEGGVPADSGQVPAEPRTSRRARVKDETPEDGN